METILLLIPAFIAGILTFLAPCTLPLLPGFLGFISGSTAQEMDDSTRSGSMRRRIFINGVFYVIGFSLVFIIMGTLFGLGGAALVRYRPLLSRIGGVLVIFFGLYMMGLLNVPLFNFLNYEKKIPFARVLKPGHPVSSILFGAAFAFGWTPCVGPILGSILALAATTATVSQGALLLAVFSAGLAIPFLIIAATAGHALQYIKKLNRYLGVISKIGGLFIVIMGILIVTDQFGIFVGLFYRWLNVLNYSSLLKYL